jgi:hypothetical protein
MAAKSYRLKIVHEGREFEAEGDKSFVLQMLKQWGPQVLGSPIREVAGSKKAKEKLVDAVVSPTASKSLSIREFIQQLNLKKHTDITVAFGYYLERHQGVSEFTPADINNCYYEAKLEASNTSQMIIQNIKRGYLMASKKGGKGKSRYTLTSSGEKFVESILQSSL